MNRRLVGEKLKKLRKSNGDSLKSLGLKIDFDWSNISKIERGERSVTVDLLGKIAAVYGVDLNYFFGGNLTNSEVNILGEPSLDLSALKQKYDFRDGSGAPVTDEEILEAVRLIRFLKQK